MAKFVTAAMEYAKDPNLHPEDIASLRNWLNKEPHLPQHITGRLSNGGTILISLSQTNIERDQLETRSNILGKVIRLLITTNFKKKLSLICFIY